MEINTAMGVAMNSIAKGSVLVLVICFLVIITSGSARAEAAAAAGANAKNEYPRFIATAGESGGLNLIELVSMCDDFLAKKKELNIQDEDIAASTSLPFKNVNEFCVHPLNDQNSVPTEKVFNQAKDDMNEIIRAFAADGGRKARSGLPKALMSYSETSTTTLGGASWQDAIIQGTTAFIAKRAEEEVLLSFVNHLQKDLCANNDASRYFPDTCRLANNTNQYARSVPWGLFKSTIEKDLNAMPYRLVEYEVVPKIKNGKNVPADIGELFYSSIDIIFLLERGASPFDTMVGMKNYYNNQTQTAADGSQTKKLFSWENEPVTSSLYLAGVFAEILQPLIEADNNKALAEKPATWMVAARLVYEEMKSNAHINLMDAAKFKQNAQQLQKIYLDFLAIAAELKQVLTTLSSPEAAKANDPLRAYRLYIQSATKVVSSFETIAGIMGKSSVPQLDKVNQVIAALNNLGDAMNHVRSKEYNLVFVDVLALVENVNELRTDKSKEILPEWYYEYGPFLVEMATAKDAESVEKALENAASPVGSWRAKRGCGAQMISLTSFFGATGGNEWINSFSDSEAIPFYGLFMPVGVEYAVGVGNYCSFQFMGSVANLGTIADFRYQGQLMKDETVDVEGEEVEVEEDPTYTFAQVFSPGVYTAIGLGDSPFLLGGGISMAPRLRTMKYDSDGNPDTIESEEVNAMRVHAFLAVDVTLFRIWGKNNRRFKEAKAN